MRRLSTTLLTACVLALSACGDGEDNVGDGEGVTTDTRASTAAAAPTASGCREVDEPRPKEQPERRKPPRRVVDEDASYIAAIKTNCGTVTIRLATDRAPKTVNSFVSLARGGFYDGLIFHRIVPDFVAQAGDPAGTGEGGPGYQVTEAPPEDLQYTRGVVAMAKTELDARGTSGSQFFIVTGPDAGLPPDYALLGRVEGSKEALDKIGSAPNDPADNRPIEPVVIEDITIRKT